MKLKNRLTLHFLLHLLALFVCVCAITFFCTYMYVFQWIPARNHIERGATDLMRKMPAATRMHQGHLSMDDSLLNQVPAGTWLEILNEQGNAVYTYHLPQNIPTHYSPGELVYDRAYPDRFHYTLFTWYDKAAGQHLTWLYGVPFTEQTRTMRLQYVYLGSLIVGSILATLAVGLFFGRRLASPLLHMMAWLQGIARGNWAEPTKESGASRSVSKWTGQLRGPYRLYREVMAALQHLAETLRRNEEQRVRLEQTREEWITGVSHDVKTPLSSVTGYAALLSDEKTSWSPEEVVRFSEIIGRQAGYIQDLIDDFNLIYRLRNEALPLSVAVEDVVELVRRAVIELVNRPTTEGQHVSFDTTSKHLLYPVDAKWFKRALDNLLANASLHNPDGTDIRVNVESHQSSEYPYPAISITIADNGQGMDEETAARMFDRYFRGTNTQDQEGRGSGLGSAIAKQLVAAHHGTIHVDTAPGQGTTVEIRLPACSGSPSALDLLQ